MKTTNTENQARPTEAIEPKFAKRRMGVIQRDPSQMGLPENRPAASVDRALQAVFANTHSLSLLTQDCHWNIRGKHFVTLHKLFDTQYKTLIEGADELAERIQMLKGIASHAAIEVQALPEVKPQPGLEEENEMVDALIDGHEALVRIIRSAMDDIESHRDFVTEDLLTRRLAFHECAVWILTNHAGRSRVSVRESVLSEVKEPASLSAVENNRPATPPTTPIDAWHWL